MFPKFVPSLSMVRNNQIDPHHSTSSDCWTFVIASRITSAGQDDTQTLTV